MSTSIIFHDFEDIDYYISVGQSGDLVNLNTSNDCVQLDITTAVKFCKDLKRKIALAKDFQAKEANNG